MKVIFVLKDVYHLARITGSLIAPRGYVVLAANPIKGKLILFKSALHFPILKNASMKRTSVELLESTSILLKSNPSISTVRTMTFSCGLDTCPKSSSEKYMASLSPVQGLFPSTNPVGMLSTFTSMVTLVSPPEVKPPLMTLMVSCLVCGESLGVVVVEDVIHSSLIVSSTYSSWLGIYSRTLFELGHNVLPQHETVIGVMAIGPMIVAIEV